MRTRCEAVAALTRPYPAMTIATVVGAPTEDAERLAAWSRWIQLQFDGPTLAEHREEVERACEELYAYLERADRPPPRRAGRRPALDADRGPRRRATASTTPSCATSSSTCWSAASTRRSHSSPTRCGCSPLTPSSGSCSPRARARARRGRRDHPRRAGDPVHGPDRRAGDRAPRRGLPRGDDRDGLRPSGQPRRRRRRADFDINARRAGKRALTFGAGIHYCLGANLARAELPRRSRSSRPRLPGLELDGEPVYDSVHGVYGLDALPIRWQ